MLSHLPNNVYIRVLEYVRKKKKKEKRNNLSSKNSILITKYLSML